jgi:hypothetical protein
VRDEFIGGRRGQALVAVVIHLKEQLPLRTATA